MTYEHLSQRARAHMMALGATSPLDPKTERDLVDAYRAGDPNAGQQVIQASMRYVISEAGRYCRALPHLDIQDVIGQGALGLAEALRKYDPSPGNRFLTYARFSIRKNIIKSIHDTLRNGMKDVVKGNNIATNLLRRKIQIQHEIEEETGEIASNHEDILYERLGEEFSITSVEAREYDIMLGGSPKSVDSIASSYRSKSSDVNPAEYDPPHIPVSNIPRPDEFVEENFDQTVLEKKVDGVLAGLDVREERIIRECFMADEPRPVAHVAKEFGISRERGRQIKNVAIRKLTHRLPFMLLELDLEDEYLS